MQFKTIFIGSVLSISSMLYANDDYIYANGVQVEMGQSQRYLESKLGIPERETAEFIAWTLKNGNTLSVQFDQYGLSAATISGSKPDYLYAHGKKIILGQDSLQSAQKKHDYGCYYQTWVEGLIGEYVVRSGPEGSWYLNFSTWGGDDETTLKTNKLTALSLQEDEPLGEEVYCTY